MIAARYLWKMEQARPDQLPPDTDWLLWLILAGRGWGKTRTGAEWLAKEAVQQPNTRWAVVAPTFTDARDTCVEGESGLQPVLNRYRMIKRWNRSLGELTLRNGSLIKLFSAEEPDRLRGPQHHGAWCDELAAWRYDDTWTQLRFGLRLGTTPRICATTTPKPRRLIKSLVARADTLITRGSTFDNAANLSAAALDELRTLYEGTRTGRQELHGELLDDVEGALWSAVLLDEHRTTEPPPVHNRLVVAIDPAVTSGEGSAETGIVVACRTPDGHIHVLADESMRGTPDTWARAAVAAYERWSADCIVVEGNQGGDLHATVIHTIAPNLPVKKVTATVGKRLRAEPVSALYEQGKVHHVGVFPVLEEQMTTWTPDDKGPSPDRLDALVWAVTNLGFGRVLQPVQRFRT